jgi:tellurite resistance protein
MHDQNMAIVKALVSVAWADGVYGEEERETVEALISAFGATDQEAADIRSYAAEKKSLDDIPMSELSTDDRRILLQHAVLLSMIDGEQHPTEKAMIEELCKRLRIPDDESKALTEAAEARAKKFLNLL